MDIFSSSAVSAQTSQVLRFTMASSATQVVVNFSALKIQVWRLAQTPS
jgi:hypothetical protein